jgi:hypothetical protein
MSRIIFTISYQIKEKIRPEYLETIQALKSYLREEKGKDYSVYEIKGTPNHFSEVYICNSVEEYDMLEDDSDDITDSLINRIVNDFIITKGKVEYRTLIEVD